MKPVGGYFELELRNGLEYHNGAAIRLNSGRNAFEYILRTRGYKKVYLPYYTCDVMLEPINKLRLEYEFYNINELLEPVFNYNLIGADETFIYINYFGIKGQFVKELSKICSNLIIDNSQAFFENPLDGIDTFYSPRKFFGVPDGAYLYTAKLLQTNLSHDRSHSRFSHLIKRIDEGAEAGFPDFKANNESMKGQSIKLMSRLTQALLCNIDYDKIIKIRKQNYLFLKEKLKETNELTLPEELDFVPMVFPYLTAKRKNIRQKLISNKVFIATYWPEVLNLSKCNRVELELVNNLIALPIDQRYDCSVLSKVLLSMQ